MRSKQIMLLCAFLCFPFALSAQEKIVTVKDCVSLALQNNPMIRVAIEEGNKALATYRIEQGKDSLLVRFGATPVIWDFTTKSTPTSPYADGFGYYPYLGFTGSYPLVNPGSDQRATISRKNIDIVKMQGKKGKDDIVVNVKTLYYGYVRMNKVVELKEQMKKNYEDRLAMLRVFVRNGDRPVLEQSQAEVSLSQVELDYKKALNQRQTILSELEAQMGLMSEEPEIAAGDFPEILPLKYDLDQVYGFIDNYSTNVQVARVKTEQARLAISASRAQHFPFVTMAGTLGYANKQVDLTDSSTFKYLVNEKKAPNKSNVLEKVVTSDHAFGNWELAMNVGMTATISVYSGGMINASVDAAIADYNKALFNERKEMIEAKKNARNYMQSIKELKDQIGIARLNIENSRTNLTLSQKSFESGIVTQLIVQNAEMAFLQSQMNLIDAQYEYLRTIAALSNLIGVEEDFLCGIE